MYAEVHALFYFTTQNKNFKPKKTKRKENLYEKDHYPRMHAADRLFAFS